METSSGQSTLEILPDEILLEVCNYLLCVDILQSFFGLNSRITRMITQYCRHVSFHKASITQSTDLCINVIPHIGSRIQSLLIERCYAVMQNDLFIKHFGDKMSIMFPRLEKIRLVAFRHNHMIDFLDTLHDLNNLVEINLQHLFDISEEHQATLLQKLFQANNSQITSITMDDGSSSLKFHNTDCYVNILQLHIKLKSIKELPSLFAAVPNVRHLDVTFDAADSERILFEEMSISSLVHLVDFRLKSIRRGWSLEELSILLAQLPNVISLALFLSTLDPHLIYGNMLLSLLPRTVQQFYYAVQYFPGVSYNQNDAMLASWPSSHPIVCYISDNFWFIHTVPWYYERMPLPSVIGKIMSSQVNREAEYNRRVKKLDFIIDKDLTSVKSLAVIAQCRRMRELAIWINTPSDAVQEKQSQPPRLPKLSRLIELQIVPSISVDLDYLSLIIVAAPNLLRLDLSSDWLIRLLENQQTNDLLRKRVKSLAILDATESSKIKLNEEHIRLIASSLTGLIDLYADLKHLTPSLMTELNEIVPSSMESMIQYLLVELKQHKLISLCVDINPSEKIQTDAKQWLQDNTILCDQQFDADFCVELKRLVVWM